MSVANKLIILGTHDFAEEVADLVSQIDSLELVAFIENQDRDRCSRTLLGKPIHWVDELPRFAGSHIALCAIGTTRRFQFTDQAEAAGIEFTVLRHPSVHMLPSASIGPGTILSIGVLVASHTVLGRHVIVNRGAMIGHHTVIGSHVTIAPGANIAGRVRIGDRAYIGMGAQIINDITIGAGAVIGAGSVVTRDVPDHVMVLGYPAAVVRQGVEGM